MQIRYYQDDAGDPHIYGHNVTEQEVEDVLARPLERTSGRGDSFVVLGRTRAGRVLKVIYSPDEDGEGIFVVTAFDLPVKQVVALNKRLRRKRR